MAPVRLLGWKPPYLAKSGMRPRRTIRFVLSPAKARMHGSKAYVEAPQGRTARISAFWSTTPTGKITGIDAKHRLSSASRRNWHRSAISA